MEAIRTHSKKKVPMIAVDGEELRTHVSEVVRQSVEETLALWGSRVSPSTISNLNQKIFERVEEWPNRPLEPKSPYIFVDGIWLKRSWGGEVQNVSVLVAIGVSTSGFREILSVADGSREDAEAGGNFFSRSGFTSPLAGCYFVQQTARI